MCGWGVSAVVLCCISIAVSSTQRPVFISICVFVVVEVLNIRVPKDKVCALIRKQQRQRFGWRFPAILMRLKLVISIALVHQLQLQNAVSSYNLNVGVNDVTEKNTYPERERERVDKTGERTQTFIDWTTYHHPDLITCITGFLHGVAQHQIHKLIIPAKCSLNFSALVELKGNCLVQVGPEESSQVNHSSEQNRSIIFTNDNENKHQLLRQQRGFNHTHTNNALLTSSSVL
jgi:hypothetical protein